MKFKTLQTQAEATPNLPLPQPASPVPPLGCLTSPYWDALRKLLRVRLGGTMSSGLVFSRSEACPPRGRRQP